MSEGGRGAVDTFVSVVVPFHDQGPIIRSFTEGLHRVLTGIYTNFEIILVDDGSNDQCRREALAAVNALSCVRSIRLPRQLGMEVAIAAGLHSAIGDYVVTIEPDCDPIELVPAIVEVARGGSDFVVGVDPRARDRGYVYRSLHWLFYRVTGWLVPFPLAEGATAFRVLSRRAVNSVMRVTVHTRHFFALVAEIGFKAEPFVYERRSRTGRPLGLRVPEAVRLGLSILLHGSRLPLRLAGLLGIAGSTISAAYAAYAALVYVFTEAVAPGWTTLSLALSGLFFLLFVMLALISEYLGFVLDELPGRPLFHVEAEEAGHQMVLDPRRPNVVRQSREEP